MTRSGRVIHKTTEAERREYRHKLQQENREVLKAQGREARRIVDKRRASIDEACRLLKAEREAQGLSLADVAERTGMSRSAISRLENLIDRNPTITTLMRLADALGKQLVISFEGPTAKRGG